MGLSLVGLEIALVPVDGAAELGEHVGESVVIALALGEYLDDGAGLDEVNELFYLLVLEAYAAQRGVGAHCGVEASAVDADGVAVGHAAESQEPWAVDAGDVAAPVVDVVFPLEGVLDAFDIKGAFGCLFVALALLVAIVAAH